MTKVKKDEKSGTYYFVYSGGTHPITKREFSVKEKGLRLIKKLKRYLDR
ncbi:MULTISPECIES: hypothetical protein [Bacillus]|nr:MULTISPECIES: hypothetical protein [Bacillus]UTL78631.1 hypothetical protein NLW79_10600 [Bacillus halotolerans]